MTPYYQRQFGSVVEERFINIQTESWNSLEGTWERSKSVSQKDSFYFEFFCSERDKKSA